MSEHDHREHGHYRHEPLQLGEPGEHPLSILLFSWMRNQAFGRFLLAAVAAACLLLAALDLLVLRHIGKGIASTPAFHGLFGFVAFALIVLSGWPLGALLRRRPDYYDQPEEDRDD